MDWNGIGNFVITLMGTGGLVAIIKAAIEAVNNKKSNTIKLYTTLEEVKSEISFIKEDLSKMKRDAEETKEFVKSSQNAIKHTQRYRLQHDMSKAILESFTTSEELQEITILYKSYISLGGNGAIEVLYERFKNLEVRDS